MVIEVQKGSKEYSHLMDFLGDNKIEVVDEYEPIAKLQKEVELVGRALREAKKEPGTWEVMNYYLRGRGVSQGTINELMGPLGDFFSNMGIEIPKD